MEKGKPLWAKLFQLPRKIRGVDLRELTHGLSRLSLNQLLLIQSLYELNAREPDGVSLKKLASELKVTPATASEMVDTLVRKGIVERRHSEIDRRAVAIRLQKPWRELFLSCEHSCMRRVDEFFAARPRSERENFERIIDDMEAFLSAHPVKLDTAEVDR